MSDIKGVIARQWGKEGLSKTMLGKLGMHIENIELGHQFALHAKYIPKDYRLKCERQKRTVFRRLSRKNIFIISW